MSRTKVLAMSLGFAMFWALLMPMALADEWNQATKMTFNESVEVPGKVLPAGTYWFKLLNDDTDRNIVQVWNSDRAQLLTTILTVPDHRLKATGKTVVKFEERPITQPEALEAWFYPGDNYGHEFVYPEARAKELAKRVGRPVLSMRDDVATNMSKPAKSAKDASVVAMKHAHVMATTPKGEETEVAKDAKGGNQSTAR